MPKKELKTRYLTLKIFFLEKCKIILLFRTFSLN